MAKNTIYDLDATFGNNTDVAGQSTQGSANANTIDTIFQKLLALLAVFGDELGGIGTVGGTADAITLTSSATYPTQSLANGNLLAFKAGSANTGAATINVDSLGAKAIRRQGDSALVANDILANGVYLIRYDTAYNSAAGAWVLLNPTVSSLEVWGGSVSDETTAITTGTGKLSFSIPYNFAVVGVYATLNTASSSGTPTFDINDGGTTILSTKIVIDANELTGGSSGYQGTASGAAVISDAAIAAFAQITVDIDTAGTGAKGAKVFLIGYRTN